MRQVNAAMLSADADGDGKISYQARVAARLLHVYMWTCIAWTCVCVCVCE